MYRSKEDSHPCYVVSVVAVAVAVAVDDVVRLWFGWSEIDPTRDVLR